jgi:hypothetical protein
MKASFTLVPSNSTTLASFLNRNAFSGKLWHASAFLMLCLLAVPQLSQAEPLKAQRLVRAQLSMLPPGQMLAVKAQSAALPTSARDLSSQVVVARQGMSPMQAMATITVCASGCDYTTIQAAVDNATAGDVIDVAAGTYAEEVTVNKSLTIQGAGCLNTIIDGGSSNANGIIVLANTTSVSINDLAVQNTNGGSNDAGIRVFAGCDGLVIDNVCVTNTPGRGGIYVDGDVDGVDITNCEVTGASVNGRGIVVWNGFKENINISNNNVHDIGGCCGIELQDGTASGVTMDGNTVERVGDSGMSAVGLTSGTGPNTMSNNTITDCGRYGIEIKNPDGTGLTTGSGSIVLDNNTISFTASPSMNIRDHAGIAVFRRAFTAGNPAGYVDVPTGVVLTNNAVSGYNQQNTSATTSEGFGIVVEGTNHTVENNTINNCDIGIQQQGGGHPNANYTPNDAGDGDQSDGQSANYFGRGNAPIACGNTIQNNTFSGNTTDERSVPAAIATGGSVTNTNTGEVFCSIQAAIDDGDTQNGHILEVSAATYDEQVLVNKEVSIKGVGITKPIVEFTGTVSGKTTLFDVSQPNVTIENLELNVDLTKLHSGIVASGTNVSGITVKDNTINATGSSNASNLSGYGDRNAVSVNYGGNTNYRIASGGVNNIVFDGNTITGTADDGFGQARFFRSGISTDESGGSFTNNTIQSINHDVLVRFGSNGAIDITDNNLNGGGVQLADMNAGAGTLTVSGNAFDGSFSNTYSNMLRLQNNYKGITTNVTNNTFTNTEWAVSLENYNSVTFDDNTFTPVASSTTYNHIVVNTKSISSNSNTIVQVVIDATFTNNTFNGSGTAGGRALVFLNHDSDNASFGTFTIGTSGNENTFNADIDAFIALDNQTGSSDAATFPASYGTGGGWTTTMAAWDVDLNVENNLFATSPATLPANMTLTQLFALENQVFHVMDDANVGLVTWIPANIYVTTNTLGIQQGVDVASANDQVNVDAGTYAENVIINKALTLNGPNVNNACGSRGAEAIIAPASGLPVSITADGVTLSGFEINAPDNRNAIILNDRSNTTISYNSINDIGTNLSGGGNIHAVLNQLGSGSSSNVTISNNCIENIGNSGFSNFSLSAIGILQSVLLPGY